jgi:septum formation protein
MSLRTNHLLWLRLPINQERLNGMEPLILASTSPRRGELLLQAGISFEINAPDIEEIHDESMDLIKLCEHNALLKVQAIAKKHPKRWILAADTLVYIDQTPLGKPKDLAEARTMLRRLSGRTHTVCTAVCLIEPNQTEHLFHELTPVEFLVLDDAKIDAYHQHVHVLDKAGGYAAQSHAEMIIKAIHGNLSNVMGLPIELLCQYFRQLKAPFLEH